MVTRESLHHPKGTTDVLVIFFVYTRFLIASASSNK